MRRTLAPEATEINLTPVMNLMVVIIPLLLGSAQFIKLGIIELNLPPGVGAKAAAMPLPKETAKRLDLAITITDEGFYISSSMAVLQSTAGQGPSIPLKEGKYDYTALTEKLYEIKQKVKGRFPDEDRVIIQAESDITYQVIIDTMDASRSTKKNEELIALFPEVSLSAGIL